MRTLRKLGQAVAFAAVVAAGVVVPATSAQATPSNCSDRYDFHSYTVYCGQGSGEFRAVVRCYKQNGSGDYTTRYGAWRTAGGGKNSVASCATTEDPASGRWEFR